MKQTITTLLKKCTKHGEFYTINVVFDNYIHENIKYFTIQNMQKYIATTKKDIDVITLIVLEILTGKQKKIIPFVFIDKSTVVYKINDDCHLVIHIDDLISRLYMLIKTHLNQLMHEFLHSNEMDHCDIRIVTIFNLCLEYDSFHKCARKTMKLYETIFK